MNVALNMVSESLRENCDTVIGDPHEQATGDLWELGDPYLLQGKGQMIFFLRPLVPIGQRSITSIHQDVNVRHFEDVKTVMKIAGLPVMGLQLKRARDVAIRAAGARSSPLLNNVEFRGA